MDGTAPSLENIGINPPQGEPTLRVVPDLTPLELVADHGPEALVFNALYMVGDFDKTPQAVQVVESEIAEATKTYVGNFVGRNLANRPGQPAVDELLRKTARLKNSPLLLELKQLRDDLPNNEAGDNLALQISHALYIGRIILQKRDDAAFSASQTAGLKSQ